MIQYFGCILLLYTDLRTAFNALLGSMIVLQLLSFIIPLVLLICRRRGTRYLPHDRAFRLPMILGWVVNVYAIIVGSTLLVFFLLPPFRPLTAQNMSQYIPLRVVQIANINRLYLCHSWCWCSILFSKLVPPCKAALSWAANSLPRIGGCIESLSLCKPCCFLFLP